MENNTNAQLMPKAPRSAFAVLGPGLVLIAMGLGSGEFVLWPYLAAHYGLGILWGAVVGVILQYFVSNETGRYTLATGNSIFVGFARLWRLFPLWFVISTFLSFAWPGIIGSGGQILAKLLGLPDARLITILMLLIIGTILTTGGKVYSTLEKVQKVFILVTLPILLLITVLLINPQILVDIAKGFVGIGQGYLFFPAGIVLGEFLGAIAYAGAGGNLVTSHSLYVQDKGLGMANNVESQLEFGKFKKFLAPREMMELSAENIVRFRLWVRTVAWEQFLTFALIGVVTIILLSTIAYALVYPFEGQQGLSFIYMEAERLSELFHPFVGLVLMLMGVIFLFTTQLGVFESTSRIMTENLQLVASRFTKYSRSHIFFFFLWSQILFAILITLLQIAAPLQILFINTFFSAVSMFVLSGAIFWLSNSRVLPRILQPGLIRKAILLISCLFFGVFTVVSLIP